MRTADGVANYFIDGPTAEKFAELCAANTPQMPSINGIYLLSENTYIYRNQYFKININSIQAPGNPSDNFDRGEPIKPNSWIGVDIQIIPWEVIEEDHDL